MFIPFIISLVILPLLLIATVLTLPLIFGFILLITIPVLLGFWFVGHLQQLQSSMMLREAASVLEARRFSAASRADLASSKAAARFSCMSLDSAPRAAVTSGVTTAPSKRERLAKFTAVSSADSGETPAGEGAVGAAGALGGRGCAGA